MFEIYHNTIGSRGTVAEVWIDKDKKLVKKFYKLNGLTVQKTFPFHNTIEKIHEFYENEMYWANKLKSKFVLETYEHGKLESEDGYYILQEWGGPDLLQYTTDELPIYFPKISQQVEEMFEFFQYNNVYKLNNAKCNLTGTNGKLRCFDLKYAVNRSAEARPKEIYSIDNWIVNIDKNLTTSLLKYV
jgi:hypothetical protein